MRTSTKESWVKGKGAKKGKEGKVQRREETIRKEPSRNQRATMDR